MKLYKLTAIVLALLLCAGPVWGASTETSDRAVPGSMYGKQSLSSNSVTAVLVDAAGNPQVDVVSSVPTTTTLSTKNTSQDLSAAALDYTTNFAAKTKIIAVMLHADGAISETVTIKLNASGGANYDTTLVTEALVSETDFVWIPDGDLNLTASDELDVDCTQAGGAQTVYVTVIGETLS